MKAQQYRSQIAAAREAFNRAVAPILNNAMGDDEVTGAEVSDLMSYTEFEERPIHGQDPTDRYNAEDAS